MTIKLRGTRAIHSGSPPIDPGPPGSFSPNPLLTGLAAGGELDLGPFTSGGVPWTFTAFSGIVYSKALNKIVGQGGGHAATDFDPVCQIDFQNTSQLLFTPIYPRTDLADMREEYYARGVGAWTKPATGAPTPRAAARHTMHMSFCRGNEYITVAGVEGNSNEWGPQLASQFPSGGWPEYPSSDKVTGGGTASHFDLVTKTWQFASPGNAMPWWPGLDYDPQSDRAFGFNAAIGLMMYDPNAKAMAVLINIVNQYWYDQTTGNPVNVYDDHGVGYNSSMVYFPPNGKFYYFNRVGDVWEITINRSNFAASTIASVIPNSGTPMSSAVASAAGRSSVINHCYDIKNKLILCGPLNGSIYAFNPLTRTWANKPVGGGKFAEWAMGAYAEVDNVFVYSDNVTSHNFAFRWA